MSELTSTEDVPSSSISSSDEPLRPGEFEKLVFAVSKAFPSIELSLMKKHDFELPEDLIKEIDAHKKELNTGKRKEKATRKSKSPNVDIEVEKADEKEVDNKNRKTPNRRSKVSESSEKSVQKDSKALKNKPLEETTKEDTNDSKTPNRKSKRVELKQDVLKNESEEVKPKQKPTKRMIDDEFRFLSDDEALLFVLSSEIRGVIYTDDSEADCNNKMSTKSKTASKKEEAIEKNSTPISSEKTPSTRRSRTRSEHQPAKVPRLE
uniref:Uncharacterized protein n=3 Tax=Caenorhabditis japonica TaxID=281687 RepID=A0A8R1HUR3_CAEJA